MFYVFRAFYLRFRGCNFWTIFFKMLQSFLYGTLGQFVGQKNPTIFTRVLGGFPILFFRPKGVYFWREFPIFFHIIKLLIYSNMHTIILICTNCIIITAWNRMVVYVWVWFYNVSLCVQLCYNTTFGGDNGVK